MLYIFFFLIAFIILTRVFSPSFRIFPEDDVTEKEADFHYLRVIKQLEDIDFNIFRDFYIIPEFDSVSGRRNPFFIGAEDEVSLPIPVEEDVVVEEEDIEEEEPEEEEPVEAEEDVEEEPEEEDIEEEPMEEEVN